MREIKLKKIKKLIFILSISILVATLILPKAIANFNQNNKNSYTVDAATHIDKEEKVCKVGLDNKEEELKYKEEQNNILKQDKQTTHVNKDIHAILIEEYKYTKESLNLRTGPGIHNELIITIPMGEKVRVIDQIDGWDKVVYMGNEGYCSSNYLTNKKVNKDIIKSNTLAKKEKSKYVSNTINQSKKELIKNQNQNQVQDKAKDKTQDPKFINGILLVNKEYGLPRNYAKGVDTKANNQLKKMVKACKDEIGKELMVHSGFRSYDFQKILFDNYVNRHGYERATKFSAKPGYSEHESGLAFDICDKDQKHRLKESFKDTSEGIWLKENAHRFGFILRYPKDKTHITKYIYEPWHFRYVGIDHANNIYIRDITLEEYLMPERY